MDILQKAHKIVYERSEEKEREYGPFIEGMMEAAKIASLLSRKDITTEDIYNCMIALKLSREAYSHKEDNLLDAVAYMSSMNDFKNRKNK